MRYKNGKDFISILFHKLYLRLNKTNELIGGLNMPNKDGTGPKGKGPKTGKRLGNCKRKGKKVTKSKPKKKKK